MASLTETAKAVLEGKNKIEEGYGINYPSVGNGSVSNPNPVDPSTASTGNAKTLRPGSKTKEEKARPQNGAGAPGNSSFEGVQDLGGATPTSTYKDNLGAKAARGENRDTSIKGSGSNAEPSKKLSAVAEEMEDDSEVVEENRELSLAERVKALKEARKHKAEKEEEEEKEEKHEGKMEKCDEDIELSEELEDFIQEGIEAGLSEEEILAAIDENFEFVSEEADEETVAEALETYEVDMAEHVNALLEGEDLSEEFQAKATTIFEAAVKAKLEEEVALLEQAYAETLEERVEEIMEELASNVDDYLNYVVEQWIAENEVAVESALRSELTEDFISGLRALFAEHYIDVPEEEVQVVEELSSTVEELEAKLNEEIQRNVELTSMLAESRKVELAAQVCEGLTDTQTQKLLALVENVEYTDDETFVNKISTLRENYFPVAVKADAVLDRVESADPQTITEENLQGPMAKYVKALGKSLPK
jgi:hypothetical protein